MEISLGGLAGKDETIKRAQKYNAMMEKAQRQRENNNKATVAMPEKKTPAATCPSSAASRGRRGRPAAGADGPGTPSTRFHHQQDPAPPGSASTVSTAGGGVGPRPSKARSRSAQRARMGDKQHMKVFGKGSSNRKLVKNALQQVCLAGYHNTEKKNEALSALDSCESSHFLILLNQNKTLAFKGLYSLDLEEGKAEKLFGLGPSLLDSGYEGLTFYKYNSAGKEFREISTKDFTVTTDAVSLQGQILFRKNGSSAPSSKLY